MAEAAVVVETHSRASVQETHSRASVQETHSRAPVRGQEQDKVARLIEDRLGAFENAIKESEMLEIDGLSLEGERCDETDVKCRIKVINHHNKQAYEVEIDSITRTPLKDLICALETGEFVKCFGITRIVGYYSRVQNWNSSKTAELADRRKGNYWEKTRMNSEKIGLLHE